MTKPITILAPRYGRQLSDFEVGATYPHPWEVTIDSGLVALYAASFLDATPIYWSREYARGAGFNEQPLPPLLCLNLALSFSVHDVSEQAIAHLAYVDVRFPAAGHVGDTVRARSTVVEVKPSRDGDKGVVGVRTVLEASDGRILCAFERKALIRAGKLEGRAHPPSRLIDAVPSLSSLRESPSELTHGPETGFLGVWEDFAPGQVWAHFGGHTVGESEHMQLSTLLRNSHPLHFDEQYSAEHSFTKHRVVYGGLVFGWAAALSSRDVAGNALWELRYQHGAHPAAVTAGDTITAASKVLGVEDRGNFGAVHFRLVGLKNKNSRAAVEEHGDALFQAELGKATAQVPEKVFEIDRLLLVRKRGR